MNGNLKPLHVITVLLFSCIICFPFINGQFAFIKEKSNSENRTKVLIPILKDKTLSDFMKELNDFYTDNFSLRNNLISIHNNFEYFVLNVSPVPKEVIVGKNNWLYNKNNYPNYKGSNAFSELELEKIKQELINRTKWAAKRGIKYYIVAVPNKMSIYPEHLPNNLYQLNTPKRYEQFVALNNDSTIRIIDLKQAILQSKNTTVDLYQHTDDHWNDLGAYYGYKSIMQTLCKDFKNEASLTPHDLSEYEIGNRDITGNLSMLLNIDNSIQEHFVELKEKFPIEGHDGKKRGYSIPQGVSDWDAEIIKENGKKKLKCVVIRDSFTMLLMRFLDEHFSETVFIHDSWRGRMREDILLKEKPTIVLNIMLETFLDRLIIFPFDWSSDEKTEESITLKTLKGKFVCADVAGHLVANRDKANTWETFTKVDVSKNNSAFLAYNNKFISCELGGGEVITYSRESVAAWEKFNIIQLNDSTIALKAVNNKFVSVDYKTNVLKAIANKIGETEKFILTKK